MASEVLVEDKPVEIKPKMRFTGTVTKIMLAGALVDINVGQPAAMHISQIVSQNEEPIMRVEDVLSVGQEIEVWVKKVKGERIELTMIEPLPLEWREIKKEMIVKGKVVRLEKFGAFVEIGAERPGLIHISELAHGFVHSPSEVIKEGDEVEAMVIEVNRRKKQIKLSLKALQPEPEDIQELLSSPAKQEKAKTASAAAPKKRKARKKSSSDDINNDELVDSIDVDTPEEEETALGIALREAMDRAKTRKQEEKAKKLKAVSQEQEDILARTLEQRSS